jgi:hypothetical protein
MVEILRPAPLSIVSGSATADFRGIQMLITQPQYEQLVVLFMTETEVSFKYCLSCQKQEIENVVFLLCKIDTRSNIKICHGQVFCVSALTICKE